MIRPITATIFLLLLVFISATEDKSIDNPQQQSHHIRRRLQDLDRIFEWWSNLRNCFREVSCNATSYNEKCCGVDDSTKYIFVTSAEYSADLFDTASSGVDRADAICASHALSAGFTGFFKAWFATSVETAPNRRFNFHHGAYVRPDGQRLYDCYSKLVRGHPPPVSLWMDETGALVTASTQGAPTNINEYGFYFDSYRLDEYALQYAPARENNVTGYYSSSSDDDVDVGDCFDLTYNATRGDELDPSEVPVGVTEAAFGLRPNAYIACNAPIRFICVEQ